MKWTEEKVAALYEALNSGLSKEETAKHLGCTPNAVRVKLQKLGKSIKVFPYYKKTETLVCEYCFNEFDAFKSEERKFCSQSCAASVNNVLAVKRKKGVVKEENFLGKVEFKKLPAVLCLNCGKEVSPKRKFCSLECHNDHKKANTFSKIKSGATSLPAKQYKAYLIETKGNACEECGWNKTNQSSGRVPIELEHIDVAWNVIGKIQQAKTVKNA